jgi:hypothetical protein
MSIPDVVKNIEVLVGKIKNNEVNYYIVNTWRLKGRSISLGTFDNLLLGDWVLDDAG